MAGGDHDGWRNANQLRAYLARREFAANGTLATRQNNGRKWITDHLPNRRQAARMGRAAARYRPLPAGLLPG
jgi:hypothetical protein